MDTIYSVYVIQSEADNRLYVGLSKDVEARLKSHNNGELFLLKGLDHGNWYTVKKLVKEIKLGIEKSI